MMVNISLYHTNVLEGSTVASNATVASGSSDLYVFDDRLSFAFATDTASTTTFQVDQPAADIRDFQYLALMNHAGMSGGTAVVKTYPTDARSSATTIISETITASDPVIFDAGSNQSGKQFIDIELTASGTNVVQLGEIALVSKFDSPKSPLVNVSSNTVPRRTYINLPNGERRSIQHGQTVRSKSFRISGLSQSEAQQWKDRFDANEGIRLLVLTDDESETYPVLWNTALPRNREVDNFTVDLEFVEIRL